MAGTGYSIETVSRNADLRSFETDWNRLSESARTPNVFTTFGWFQAWSERFERDDHSSQFCPHVLILKQAGTVVGLSPLTCRRQIRFGISVRKLEFAGVYADYNDLVLGEDAAGQINAIADYLAENSKRWDVLDLRDLRDGGEGVEMLKDALTRAGLPFILSLEKEGCPYTAIDGNAECLMKRLSGHTRRTLRRRSERAVSEGLNIRIIEDPHDEPHLLETLVELERKKHHYKLWATFLGDYQEVFQSLFDTLGPLGWIYVALMEQRGHPIAFQLGFRCGQKLWDYTKAYDRSFSRFAPGTLLLPALLDYAFEHGYDELDFLRGEEPYKLVWSTGCHRRFRLLVWNERLVSRLHKFLYHAVKSAVNGL